MKARVDNDNHFVSFFALNDNRLSRKNVVIIMISQPTKFSDNRFAIIAIVRFTFGSSLCLEPWISP